jgi:NADH-quinone oxidoreductase E subunit
MLPALHAAQEEYGWLPSHILDEIAIYLDVHPAQVREVASFYTMYYLDPVGRYHLKICTNVACHLRGADILMQVCEEKLGIKAGETSHDHLFTLSHEECLGSCGTAPVMMLNDTYIENLDSVQLESMIDKLSEGS